MRSLEECKAEVFRRSEERIKNKKKTNIKRVVVAGLSTAAGIVLTVCTIKFIDVMNFKMNEKYTASDADGTIINGAGAGECLDEEPEIESTVMGNLTETAIDFEVQYIKGSRWGDVEYPCVTVIKSVGELEEYLKANEDDGLQEACSNYDSEYFEKQVLILYRISEGSGSTRHNVKSLMNKGVVEDDAIVNKLYIEIERLSAEVGTCDMAEWYILIEPEADFDIDEEDIEIKNMMRRGFK